MALRVQTVANVGTGSPAGAQAPYNCDWMQTPFGLSWSVENLGTAVTGTFSVQQTFDDVNTVAAPVWTDVVTAATGNANGLITEPIQFLRINVTTGPSGGSITFRTIQGMSSR
jgi:hypothetical protein